MMLATSSMGMCVSLMKKAGRLSELAGRRVPGKI